MMTLEHYPGMTEPELARIEAEARSRCPLQASLIVHRMAAPAERQHRAGGHRVGSREAAFAAAQFLMDYLKTRAPFWKRESGPEGTGWVEANARDDVALARWRTIPKRAAE